MNHCTQCSWTGTADELRLKTYPNGGDDTLCPKCGGGVEEIETIKNKNMYCYIKSEPGLYTVGFYAPDGEWNPDSDYSDKEEAAKRVSYLNGNKLATPSYSCRFCEKTFTDEYDLEAHTNRNHNSLSNGR